MPVTSSARRSSLLAAQTEWRSRSRFWEGSWAQLDLAALRPGNASPRRGHVAGNPALTAAEDAGAGALVRAAESLLTPPDSAAPAWHPLTTREHEVATLVGQGMTNREIAAALFLSPKTVSAHVEHILAKLGASRRAEIAAWVARVNS